MRRPRFVTLDVFTTTRFGGNPLAVVPDAAGISDAEMQALAAEFNLSETTFVLPPADPANTARVRIFNRTSEMPFAGHPSVGTAVVLAALGRARDGAVRMEQPAGVVEARLWRDPASGLDGATIAAPRALVVGDAVPAALVAACAGIDPGAVVAARHPPTVASDGGNPRILVEVSAAGLAAAAPDRAAFRAAAAALPALGGKVSLYLYRRDGDALRARMFSPLSETPEDPATGSAATPLAGFLLRLDGGGEGAWTIHQGVEMGRPSVLHASAARTPGGIRARVGGTCVPVLEGTIRLD